MKVLIVLAALIVVAVALPNNYRSEYQTPFRSSYGAKEDGYRRASYKSDYGYVAPSHEEQGSCPPWGTSTYSDGQVGGRSCFPGNYAKNTHTDNSSYEPKKYSVPSYTPAATYDYVKPAYTDDEDYTVPVKAYHAPTKAYYAPEARQVEQGSCAPWGVSSYEKGQIGGYSCFPGTSYSKPSYTKTEYAHDEYVKPTYTAPAKAYHAPETYHQVEQGSCAPWDVSSYENGQVGGRSCFPGSYAKPSYHTKTDYASTTYDYVKPSYTQVDDYAVPAKSYHTPSYHAPETRQVEQGSCAPWGVSSYENGKVGGRSCFPGNYAKPAYTKTEYAPAKPAYEHQAQPNWHYRRQ